MEPGANPPVDEYPILKLIPRRFAFWKRRAILAGATMDSVWGEAVARVKKRRAGGDRRDCITDTLLDQWGKNNMPMSQHAFNNLVGELVEGAADTTAAQLLTLVMAFAKNPRVQKRAQEELDKVCGTERSPLWTDFERLPYINAIVKEGMRWRPVAVTGSPHRVREGEYLLSCSHISIVLTSVQMTSIMECSFPRIRRLLSPSGPSITVMSSMMTTPSYLSGI